MLHSRAAVRAKNRIFCSFGTRQSLAMSYGQLRAVATEAEQYPHGITSLSDSSKMANTVQQLGHVSIEEFQPSNFVKPQSVFYELDGAKRRWCGSDIALVHVNLPCSASRVAARLVKHTIGLGQHPEGQCVLSDHLVSHTCTHDHQLTFLSHGHTQRNSLPPHRYLPDRST